MKKQIFALGLILSLVVACAKKEEETAATEEGSTTPADGSQTASTLAGDGTYCEVHTDVGGTYAFVHYMSLAAGGTYSYSVYFTDAATCSTVTGSSGNNYATYNQSGTFSLNGAANISGTGTIIQFTPTSQSMIIRSGTAGGQAQAQALATWMNNSCSYAPGYNTAANDTKTLNQHICNLSGSFASQSFPVNGATNYQNVIYKNGTTLQIGQPTSFYVWGPFGTSTPTSYAKTFYSW